MADETHSELRTQNELLTRLDDKLEQTQTRVQKNTKQMKNLIR